MLQVLHTFKRWTRSTSSQPRSKTWKAFLLTLLSLRRKHLWKEIDFVPVFHSGTDSLIAPETSLSLFNVEVCSPSADGSAVGDDFWFMGLRVVRGGGRQGSERTNQLHFKQKSATAWRSSGSPRLSRTEATPFWTVRDTLQRMFYFRFSARDFSASAGVRSC